MKKMILFVDNNEEFLDVHAQLLTHRGYTVVKAKSVAEAERQLQQFNIHLGIFDIRLEDDHDALDISGLELAQNTVYRYLPKIILTAYPSWEYAEMALGATLKGLQVVGMIAKADGAEKILDAVDKAFASEVPINWNLIIRTDDSRLSILPYLVTAISPTVEGEQLSLRIEEVRELFSRLFIEHEQIYIDRVITRLPGRVWLAVSAFVGHEDERHYLVDCGRRSLIQKDREQYKKLGLNNNNSLFHLHAETAHYGAYTITLPGISSLENVVTLLEFYRHHSLEQVFDIIKHLFQATLGPLYQKNRFWYEEKGIIQLQKLWLKHDDLAQVEGVLAACVQSMCDQAMALGLIQIDCSEQRLTLRQLEQEDVILPNPVNALLQKSLELSGPLLFGTAHGRLNGTAVLTDTKEHSWIIDYAHLNRGPLLQDFVSLEAAIKYDMLVTQTFEERYKLENLLLTTDDLDVIISLDDSIDPEINKAVQIISLVRQEAARTGINTRHYQVGIVLNALGNLLNYNPNIKYTRRELMPFLHNLISAAKVYQQLVSPTHSDLPAQALYSIWMDEERQAVWVEGQEKSLTPQEYDLLHFLYKNAGSPCDRDKIMKEVFDLEYNPDWSEAERRDYSDPRINSAISRLRKKIEPDQNENKYIISVWGKGYMLRIEQ